MANFTINSLSSQTINGSDKIVKSNSDGVLSNASMNDLKQFVSGGSTEFNYAEYINAKANRFEQPLNTITSKDVTGTTPVTIWEGDINIPHDGIYVIDIKAGFSVRGGVGFWKYSIDNLVSHQTAHVQSTNALAARTDLNSLLKGTHHFKLEMMSSTESGTMHFEQNVFGKVSIWLA